MDNIDIFGIILNEMATLKSAKARLTVLLHLFRYDDWLTTEYLLNNLFPTVKHAGIDPEGSLFGKFLQIAMNEKHYGGNTCSELQTAMRENNDLIALYCCLMQEKLGVRLTKKLRFGAQGRNLYKSFELFNEMPKGESKTLLAMLILISFVGTHPYSIHNPVVKKLLRYLIPKEKNFWDQEYMRMGWTSWFWLPVDGYCALVHTAPRRFVLERKKKLIYMYPKPFEKPVAPNKINWEELVSMRIDTKETLVARDVDPKVYKATCEFVDRSYTLQNISYYCDYSTQILVSLGYKAIPCETVAWNYDSGVMTGEFRNSTGHRLEVIMVFEQMKDDCATFYVRNRTASYIALVDMHELKAIRMLKRPATRGWSFTEDKVALNEFLKSQHVKLPTNNRGAIDVLRKRRYAHEQLYPAIWS